MAAGQVATGRAAYVPAAAQYLSRQLQGQHLTWPAEEVDRDHGPPAHRIHVGQRVGRRDPVPVVGVVDHRSEEVRSGDHCNTAFDPHHRGVVTVVQTDDQLAGRISHVGTDQSGHHRLQFAGRDLAGAATAVRVLGEPDRGRCHKAHRNAHTRA